MFMPHANRGKVDTATPAVIPAVPDGIQSEEEKIAAMFNVQETKWKEQQQEMAQ